MRHPRASAVVVALSTFVVVAVVAAVVSQLTPLDRAGAALPEGPISVTGAPVEQPTEDGPSGDSPSGSPGDAASDADDVGTEPDADGASVVEPAPAVTVDPDPTTPPAPAPTAPGNSGSAPGQTSAPGNSGGAPGQSKP